MSLAINLTFSEISTFESLRMESANDEMGMEIFYDFAITPAIRFIPSYQHIWDPITARVSKHENGADVFFAG